MKLRRMLAAANGVNIVILLVSLSYFFSLFRSDLG